MNLAIRDGGMNCVCADRAQFRSFKYRDHLHLGAALFAPGRPVRVATRINDGPVAFKNDFGSPGGFHRINIEISVCIWLLYNRPTDSSVGMSIGPFGALKLLSPPSESI